LYPGRDVDDTKKEKSGKFTFTEGAAVSPIA
jgi:hypothetical protein